jgi:MarR family transcriptional regulator for hemolysin
VLTFLWRFPKVNQVKVADFLNQDKTSVTRLIDVMEKTGKVTREISEIDKRNKLLSLTDKGKTLYANLLPHIEKTLETAYDGLKEEDVEFCKNVLLKMQENLLDEN